MLSLIPTFDGKRTIPSLACRVLIMDLLKLDSSDKVLEIGTGSGTQTHDLKQTGAIVHSIELEPWIDTTITEGECVSLHAGDGLKGLPDYAPFTAIVATCGVSEIPQSWAAQLSDGGRLVVPIGDVRSQRLTLFRKHGSELIPERIGAYVRFQMYREPDKPRPPKYQPYGTHVPA